MVVLGLLVAMLGKPKLYLVWLGIMVILGILGLYDFYNWLYIYGHELDPNAILQITDPLTGKPMGYQPPFIGYKKILNFEVYSYPEKGAYMVGLSMLSALIAFFVGKKEIKSSK